MSDKTSNKNSKSAEDSEDQKIAEELAEEVKNQDSGEFDDREEAEGSEVNPAEEKTDDEVEKPSEEEKLQQQVFEEKDKFMRLFAEFENYKRRTSKERVELFKTASQELMQALLPVLDDFDRAISELRKVKDKELLTGVELIHDKFSKTLKQKGLEPMKVKQGDKFDPELHEAVTQIPAPKKKLKGKIVDVVETGFTLGNKIIRFPKVVTGK
jgi:molecular chaperone GrpE